MRNRDKEVKEEVVAVEETKVEEPKNELQLIMDLKGYPTLKAIAAAFNLQAMRLYSVAKQPKEGMVYDAKVYNWDAILRFLQRRIGQNGVPSTLEEVIDRALELDEEFKAADGRKREARGANKGTIEVDGKTFAQRKFSIFEMQDGQLFCIKNDPEVYKAVYQTVSHTVLVPVSDREGTIKNTTVKVISNTMLNFKGIGPAQLDKAVAERFEATANATTATAEAEAVAE